MPPPTLLPLRHDQRHHHEALYGDKSGGFFGYLRPPLAMSLWLAVHPAQPSQFVPPSSAPSHSFSLPPPSNFLYIPAMPFLLTLCPSLLGPSYGLSCHNFYIRLLFLPFSTPKVVGRHSHSPSPFSFPYLYAQLFAPYWWLGGGASRLRARPLCGAEPLEGA